MRITWYGHAAFLLEAETGVASGLRVGLDPYRAPDAGTYLPIDDSADMVAISHFNEKYHSQVDAFRGRDGQKPYLINGLALLQQSPPEVAERGITFTATRVWENEERREPIAMVGVRMDGVRALHMGDCGHGLTAEEIKACGSVDVLLALAGGAPTLSLPELAEFIRELKPRVVIPMHFGNAKINLNLQPVEALLALLPDLPQRFFPTPTISLLPDTLPTSPEVWALPPAR